MAAVSVSVHAADPISRAGIEAQLRCQRDITVVEPTDGRVPDVAILASDEIGEATLRHLRSIQRETTARVVLLVSEAEEARVLLAVEEGAVGVLRRREASASQLAALVHSAKAGGGSLPADLLGGLMRQVKHVHHAVLAPRGMSFSHLDPREVAVLRLLADGCGTREIAAELCYSERTIKNVIQDIVRRFGLRNRSHAVAYALRQGLI